MRLGTSILRSLASPQAASSIAIVSMIKPIKAEQSQTPNLFLPFFIIISPYSVLIYLLIFSQLCSRLVLLACKSDEALAPEQSALSMPEPEPGVSPKPPRYTSGEELRGNMFILSLPNATWRDFTKSLTFTFSASSTL